MHSRFERIGIAGICAAVPANLERISDLMARADAKARFTLKRVAALAGLRQRHVCQDDLYTGDLALAAGQELLARLGWDPKSVDLLFFTSQTPDFLSPPTGYLIAAALGLSENCVVTDISAGCSGMVQSAWLACGQINTHCRRALVLSGDASSKVVPRDDIGNSVLMGDGVGAVALEFDQQAPALSFHILNAPDTRFSLVNYNSGYRPMSGNGDGMVMDGNAITEFCLAKVPFCMEEHLNMENVAWNEVKRFFLHQPNKMILDTLQRRLGIDKVKLPMIFADYANCSSGSLPINVCMNGESYEEPANIMFCAFGSGLSVASMLVKMTRNPAFPPVLVPKACLLAEN